MDLALNNLQKLICHKTKQTKPIYLVAIYLVVSCVFFIGLVWFRFMAFQLLLVI